MPTGSHIGHVVGQMGSGKTRNSGNGNGHRNGNRNGNTSVCNKCPLTNLHHAAWALDWIPGLDYWIRPNSYNASFGIWRKLIHLGLASLDDPRNGLHCHYSHVTSSLNNSIDQQVKLWKSTSVCQLRLNSRVTYCAAGFRQGPGVLIHCEEWW